MSFNVVSKMAKKVHINILIVHIKSKSKKVALKSLFKAKNYLLSLEVHRQLIY